MTKPITGHSTIVNYYSNPNIMLPQTNTPTGVLGMTNNARIITMNRQLFPLLSQLFLANHFPRFLMAKCGDAQHNGLCHGTSGRDYSC